MRGRVIVIAISAFLGAQNSLRAQISPGELSQAHMRLEGLTNCTQCHTLGKTVGNDKCLACHTEIQTRIAANRGYHATVQRQQCSECHKEHYGRTFSLVRMNTKTFNHAIVGFPLQGKHRTTDCAQCHKRDFIRATDILQNAPVLTSNTYLGLSAACNACHLDAHRGQLPAGCNQCHNTETWSPAPGFDHNKAKYVLTGKHLQVSCGSCHKRVLDNGKTIQFVGLKFPSCSACHGDPHSGRFRQACESCHTTNGWEQGAARGFDHSTTRFPLRGKHASVSCEACHGAIKETRVTVQSSRFHISRFQHCVDCHADPHMGEFARRSDGGACESCHTEKSFRPSTFSHATSSFPLRGKHAEVKCEKCHELTKGTNGVPALVRFKVQKFNQCAACHEDAHFGQFAERADGGACESCHTENGFSPSLFTVAMHAKARFALAGAHAAVSCTDCHRPGNVGGKRTRIYHWSKGVDCETCHRDIHLGECDRVMNNGCETCHSVARWSGVKFDHNRTKYPLEGKHAGVACRECHRMIDVGSRKERRQFTGLPTRCVDCHGNTVLKPLETGTTGQHQMN